MLDKGIIIDLYAQLIVVWMNRKVNGQVICAFCIIVCMAHTFFVFVFSSLILAHIVFCFFIAPATSPKARKDDTQRPHPAKTVLASLETVTADFS